MNRAVFRVRMLLPVLAVVLARGGVLAETSGGWRVPEASLRFTLEATRMPSHTSAGFLVEIPDGGLLPDRGLLTTAFTASGTPVGSFTLWHNPARSLTLVMEDSGSERRFTVYVQPFRQYRLWTPASGLFPSALLVTDPSQASLRSANAIAALGPVPAPVHFVRKAGIPRAPLSIGGDETGRPRPASFYLLAHVVSADPGRTWMAPFTLDGSGEVRVNGTTLRPRKRIDKWGGTGDWADIRPGPNRVEVLHIAPGTEGFFTRGTGGLMYLTWRTPNATMQELGGVRSEAVPMPGTSRMETRVIREEEILRSGACALLRAEFRDGRPVAVIRATEARPYWFGDETPMLLYTWETQDPRPDAAYAWSLPGNLTVSGPRIDWLLPGFQEHRISLSASSAGQTTSAQHSFYGFSTRRTSLEHAGDRRDFRRALRTMAEAHPAGDRAVERWDPSLWRTLLRTAELGQGTPLLTVLFQKHAAALRRNLAVHEFEALQDLFLEALARVDVQQSIDWTATFLREATDPRRRGFLTVWAAELTLYYRRDLDAAEALLRSLNPPERDDLHRLLRIRYGDLALLRGDLNLATRYYASVQNESRIRRSVAERNILAETGSRAPVHRARLGTTMDQVRSDDWKLQALVDASASESIRSLIEQGYLIEAHEMLRLWERDLPLSKISADYVILEARLYQAIHDPLRALGLLQAFCDTVEASNALPEAAPLLLSILVEAGEPPESIVRTGERFRRLLEFHPEASRELEAILRRIPETAATPGRPPRE